METSLRQATNTLKTSTDTCEVVFLMKSTSKRNVCVRNDGKIRITEAKFVLHKLIRWEKLIRALRISNIHTKRQSIFQYYSQFVVLATLDRRETAECIHCASVQLYYLRITSVTLPLLSAISRTPLLRRTVGVGPDGVHLRESLLYFRICAEGLKCKFKFNKN